MNLTNLDLATLRCRSWEQSVYKLHEIIDDLSVINSLRWADRKDKSSAFNIIALLNQADMLMLDRFQQVINDKVNALRGNVTEVQYGQQ